MGERTALEGTPQHAGHHLVGSETGLPSDFEHAFKARNGCADRTSLLHTETMLARRLDGGDQTGRSSPGTLDELARMGGVSGLPHQWHHVLDDSTRSS